MPRKATTSTLKAFGKKIAAIFDQRFEGTVEGPHRIGPYVISRVWTEEDLEDEDDIEYHAHYAVERSGELQAFEDFAPFANWLTDELDLDKAAERRERFIRVTVAAIVTLGGFGVFAYLASKNQATSPNLIGYLATAVVGGGAGLLFGNWSKAKKDQG